MSDELPKISVSFGGVEYDLDPDGDYSIDRTDLDTEFQNQAKLYAKYAYLSECAKRQYEVSKAEFDQLCANLDHKIRMDFEIHKAKNPKFKATEKMCENAVKLETSYGEKQREVIDNQFAYRSLEKYAVAFAQRKDMLMQMGAHQRAGSEPMRILEKEQDDAVKNLINKR